MRDLAAIGAPAANTTTGHGDVCLRYRGAVETSTCRIFTLWPRGLFCRCTHRAKNFPGESCGAASTGLGYDAPARLRTAQSNFAHRTALMAEIQQEFSLNSCLS